MADPTKNDKLAQILLDQWEEARSWADTWREDAHEERRFFDGDQWDQRQKAQLEVEGRPPLVINRISKALGNLIGRERDSRLSWKAVPRGAEDVMKADGMTKALAYVADTLRAKYTASQVFEDAIKGPFGVAEVGMDDQDPTREPLFIRRVDPFEIYPDPYSVAADYSDARYLIRRRWLDLDLVLQAFPNKEDEVRSAISRFEADEAQQSLGLQDDYGNGKALPDSQFWDEKRQRVALREHWFWQNQPALFVVYPDGHADEFDRLDPNQAQAFQMPGVTLRQGTKRVFYWAIQAGESILGVDASPYPFGRMPYVFLWCYRQDDGVPYGLIRHMKDPQKELNVARSRFNEAIRSRWLLHKPGALGSKTSAQVAKMLARPTFVLEVDPEKVQMGSDREDGKFWLDLMAVSQQDIDDSIGQNEANYGDASNERSGAAIRARVAQAGLTHGRIFDNYRFFRLQLGEMLLSLMQRFYSIYKIARIIEAGTLRDGVMPDLSWLQEVDFIDQLSFDVVIEDQAETTTERQAAMAEAIQLTDLLPDEARAILAPDLIRMSDFASKEAMARKAEMAIQFMLAPPPPPPGAVEGSVDSSGSRPVENGSSARPGSPNREKPDPRGAVLPDGSPLMPDMPQNPMPQRFELVPDGINAAGMRFM